jgi:hypothetical protein
VSNGGSAYEAHTFGSLALAAVLAATLALGAGPAFAATITEVSPEVCKNSHATESSHSRVSASPVGSGVALLSGFPECAFRAPELWPPLKSRCLSGNP